MAELAFELNTDPHVVTISGKKIRFVPEADAALLLTARAHLRKIDADEAAKLGTGKLDADDEAKLVDGSTEALNQFCRSLMVGDEDRETWDALQPLPDRVLIGTQRFLLEQYSMRPTSPQNDS